MQPLQRIASRAADLGDGLIVRRVLPTVQQRMVGAWCFLDHAGPIDFAPGGGMHVGAHPHTGLQTFTWLIEGEVMHRDSLGNAQLIRPGQVNLMTAGRGIAHTEDSLPGARRLHAAQLWIALPPSMADCPPDFAHHPELPAWDHAGCRFTLLAGRFGEHLAPARVHTPLISLDIFAESGAGLDDTFTLPLDPRFEYGLLPLEGRLRVNQQDFASDEFAYVPPGAGHLQLALAPRSRVLLAGGEPFAEPVLMWWNFVGHSKEAIARAQHDWEAGGARFGVVPESEGRRLVPPPLPWAGY